MENPIIEQPIEVDFGEAVLRLYCSTNVVEIVHKGDVIKLDLSLLMQNKLAKEWVKTNAAYVIITSGSRLE